MYRLKETFLEVASGDNWMSDMCSALPTKPLFRMAVNRTSALDWISAIGTSQTPSSMLSSAATVKDQDNRRSIDSLGYVPPPMKHAHNDFRDIVDMSSSWRFMISVALFGC
jgi:hypothetical protein